MRCFNKGRTRQPPAYTNPPKSRANAFWQKVPYAPSIPLDLTSGPHFWVKWDALPQGRENLLPGQVGQRGNGLLLKTLSFRILWGYGVRFGGRTIWTMNRVLATFNVRYREPLKTTLWPAFSCLPALWFFEIFELNLGGLLQVEESWKSCKAMSMNKY